MKKTVKRLLGLIISMMLVPAASILPQVCASEFPGAEFITNGGFETANPTNSLAPAGWSFANGSVGTHFVLDTDDPKTGAGCLEMNVNGSKYVYIYQGIRGLVGNKEYTVRVDFCSEKAVSVMVKLEYKTINAEGITKYVGEKYETFTVQKGKVWQTKTMTVTAPAEAYTATVMIRLQQSTGTVYVDNASVFGEQRPDFIPEIDAGSLPVYAEKEAASGTEELLANGNMEEMNEEGEPYGWSATDNDWTKNVQYTAEYSHGNNGHSIRLSNTGDSTPYAIKIVRDITPLSEHQVSVFLKVHALSSVGFGFKFEYLDSAYTCLKAELSARYHAISGEHWVKFVLPFMPPAGTSCVRIYFRLFGTGIVYIDDASCIRTEDPYKIQVSADQVYYYSDCEEVKVTARVNTVTYPELEGKDVFFRLLLGDRVMSEATATVSSAVAQWHFAVSAMEKEKEKYTVTAELAGEVSFAEVYRYDRPQRMGKDGIYRIEGNVFHPVFAYHVDPQYYEVVGEAGINVVQCVAEKEKLDAVHAAGLKALVVLYRDMYPAGHPRNATFTKAFVEENKNHPAVFAWAVMDEPFSHDPGAEPYLKNAYKIIRDADDVHPVFVMEVGDKKDVAAKYTDIFGIDPYVSKNDPAQYVAGKVRESVAVSLGKPVYTLLQAFLYNGYFPSGDAMRSMLYQALLGGSAAVGYYCFDTAKPLTPLNQTELWPALTAWYESEAEILFSHLRENADMKIAACDDGTARWHIFIADGNLYVAAMNLSSEEKEITVPLPTGFVPDTVSVVGGAMEQSVLSCFDGELRLSLQPTGAALYRISDRETAELYCVSDCAPVIKAKEGKVKFFYAGEPADVYIGVYNAQGELCDLGSIRNAAEGTMVTIPPDGEYAVRSFVFYAGTVRPRVPEHK